MGISSFIKRNVYWAKDFLHGKKVRRYYEDLENILPDKSIGYSIQQEHLKEILNYATEYSEFYRKYTGCSLIEFPIVNKLILNEHYSEICIPTENIPGQEETTVYIQKTSGSTGTPFAIPQDTGKRNRRTAELKYFNSQVGIKSHEMLCHCRVWTKRQNMTKWQSFKENIIPINISVMDDNTISQLTGIVKKRKVCVLRAYGGWYDAIANYYLAGKGEINDLKTIKVCISTSEALNESARETMKEIADIPIVETYANEEAGVLAQQKIGDNNYYLNHSGYVFEFLKIDTDEMAEPGELARVIITDMYNHAFPLIRYDTGDIAVYEEGKIESGGWEYISKLYGRRADLVYDTKGQPVHPFFFSRILKHMSEIIQWQFVQKEQKKYVLKLNGNWNRSVEKTIREVKEILGDDAVLDIEFVDDIPVLASGKRKSVVCEWKRT